MKVIPLPKELIDLAGCFPNDSPLYLVGGATRNFILGYPLGDYDLASSASVANVIEITRNTGWHIVQTIERIGTVILKNGLLTVEYTTFRIDSYPSKSGQHLPCEVTFTSSIAQDCFRRDFSCNAIYYDIKNAEFVDVSAGIPDTQNRIIRCVREPGLVLREDALRIMRMVRLAGELEFAIDSETYQCAKKYSFQLKDISIERIRAEFDKILVCESKYGGVAPSVDKWLRALIDIGAMDFIIPELLEGDGIAQNPLYHKYDVLEHILHTVLYAPPHLRMVALFHDIAKPRMLQKSGRMAGHDIEGGKMTDQILKRLKYPNSVISYTVRMVENHMFNLNCQAKDTTIRQFIAKNADIIQDLIDFRRIDERGGGVAEKTHSVSADILQTVYDNMIAKNIPFCLKDLKINGNDLQKIGYQGSDIGNGLTKLLNYSICEMLDMTKEEQLLYLDKNRR